MKKNLLIISSDFSLESGGIENTSFLFAEYFSKEMNVITLSPSSGHDIEIDGVISYKSIYPQNSFLFLIDSIAKVISIHKKHHVDYVLSVHFGYAFCSIFLKLLFGVPFGVLAHGEEVIKWRKGTLMQTIKYTIYYPIRYSVFKFASQIFTNTHYTKGLVEKITSNRRIFVVNPPMGLLPEMGEMAMDKHHIILSIGRMDERKGYQNVIKALPKVIEKISDIKYVIAGGGDMEERLRNMVKEKHLENHVEFKGRVSEEEKCNLLSNCGLFVMHSFLIPHVTVEGFGIVLLEANSYGKFVVSSYSGGIPEAVDEGRTGFLVKENDIDGLAEAILKFYSPEFKYNPKDCIDWAKKRHISNIVSQYLQHIKEIVK